MPTLNHDNMYVIYIKKRNNKEKNIKYMSALNQYIMTTCTLYMKNIEIIKKSNITYMPALNLYNMYITDKKYI